MFGYVGHLKASDSEFYHSEGDQFSTDVAPPPGMAGPMDPQFQSSRSSAPSTNPSHAPNPMFRHIGYLEADRGTFYQSGDAQFIYDISDSRRSLPSSTHAAIPQTMAVPQVHAKSTPSSSNWSSPLPDATHSSTGAEMFARVDYLESKVPIYKHSSGHQIIIQGMQGRATHALNHTAAQTDRHDSIFVQAARVTSDIRNGVQRSLPNDNDFARLARRACTLVDSVSADGNELEQLGRQLAPGLVVKLAELVGKLRSIEQFVNAPYSTHALKVAEHRRLFREALVEFETSRRAISA